MMAGGFILDHRLHDQSGGVQDVVETGWTQFGPAVMCPYSGLPGDTGCTTDEITKAIPSTISKGTTEDGEEFPTTVTIHLEVPIEGRNRGVTLFGDLPGLTVYGDTLDTMNEDTVIDWQEIDTAEVAAAIEQALQEIDEALEEESQELLEDVEPLLGDLSTSGEQIGEGDVGAVPDAKTALVAIEDVVKREGYGTTEEDVHQATDGVWAVIQ